MDNRQCKVSFLRRWAFDTNVLRYAAYHLDLQMIGELMGLIFVFVELGALVSGHVI